MNPTNPQPTTDQKALLLLNLGSPDAPTVPAVRRYLKEFLSDARVWDGFLPLRWLVLQGFILPFRPHASAEAYSKIWTAEGSPLMVISQQQRTALASALEKHAAALTVELAMRYGSCSIPKAIQRLKQKGTRSVFLLPLYPHYAMSSYETVVARTMEELHLQLPNVAIELLQPFYSHPAYIDALVQSAQPYLQKPYDLLLFSFHGLPKRHLCQTDPSHAHCQKVTNCCAIRHPAHATCYRHQCLETARQFAAKAGLPPNRYRVSFQSRLGREPWLTPYTDETLKSLPQAGVKRLLVICPAFVADCLETLEEINMTGRETFLATGGTAFDYIPCLNTQPAFIQFLEGQVRPWLDAY